jgi:hypothetical protein
MERAVAVKAGRLVRRLSRGSVEQLHHLEVACNTG